MTFLPCCLSITLLIHNFRIYLPRNASPSSILKPRSTLAGMATCYHSPLNTTCLHPCTDKDCAINIPRREKRRNELLRSTNVSDDLCFIFATLFSTYLHAFSLGLRPGDISTTVNTDRAQFIIYCMAFACARPKWHMPHTQLNPAFQAPPHWRAHQTFVSIRNDAAACGMLLFPVSFCLSISRQAYLLACTERVSHLAR